MSARLVLVIDDDDDVREITTLALQVMGDWEVLGADGGEEGVRLARAHQPTLVLLDVMMPGMDGPATFRALQADARTCHIPVILLTAKVQLAENGVADPGIAGVIAKPFDPLTLVEEIDRMLEDAEGRTRESV